MPGISVQIPVDGDWPSPEDMEARNAITDDLDAAGIGEFTGAGGGMGAMDFSYDVSSVDTAKAQIEAALQKHLPGREFSINVLD